MIEWYWSAQHSWRAVLGVHVLQSAATPLEVTRSYTLGLHWNTCIPIAGLLFMILTWPKCLCYFKLFLSETFFLSTTRTICCIKCFSTAWPPCLLNLCLPLHSRRTKVNRVHLRVAGSDCLPLSYCSEDPWDVAFCSSHWQVSQCWLSADLCWVFIVLHQSLLFQHLNDPFIFSF